MTDSIAEVAAKAEGREKVLRHCADLFEEVATFMEEVCHRTFAAYDSARQSPDIEALMRKHRQALAIRDDYRGLTRENREDADNYAALRAHLMGMEA